MPLALDTASAFPLTAKHNVADGSFNTISISGVTTSANAMVVVVVTGGGTNAGDMFPLTLDGVTGLSWTLDESQGPTSGSHANTDGSWIWHGYSTTGLSNQTIKITYKGPAGTGAALLAVYSFVGASSTIGNLDGAFDNVGTTIPVGCTISLSAGSIAVCGGMAVNTNGAPVALANSTMDISTTENVGNFGSYGIFHLTAPTTSSGNVTFGRDLIDQSFSNRAGVEILVVQGGVSESAGGDVLLGVYGPFGAVAGAYQTTAFQTNVFQEAAGGAGPTTYNEPLTVSATATDSVDPGLKIPVSVADSSPASESLVPRTAGAEPIDVTSTPSVLFGFITGAWAATESDQASPTDTLGLTQVVSASLSDSAAPSDSFATALVTVSSSVSESASATESVSPGLAIPVSESDSTSASVIDALSFSVGISASSTASDSLAAAIAGTNAFTESSTATATDATAQAGAQTLSEIATVTDGLSPGTVLSKTISESSTATDTVDSQFPGLCFASESATASDTFTTTQAGAQTDNHSAAASDDSAPGLVINVTLSESTSATDTVGPGLQLSYTISENPQATDTVLPGLQLSYSVLEQANAAEIVDSLLATGDRQFAESATATEQFALTQRMLEAAANNANASVLLDAVVATPAGGTNFYIFICDD